MIFLQVLSTEFTKLKRTKITWALGLVYCIAPFMVSLMMMVLKEPELARRMGLIAQKAQIAAGSADWPTYLTLTALLFMVGMIVLGIAEAFMFGREYAEGTAKNMLTLPVGRGTIVAAKLLVASAWFLIMCIAVYGESIALGFLVGLPGFVPGLIAKNALLVVRLVLEVLMLGSVTAWIAVAGRGYLAPVGFTILGLFLGDLFAHTGWGLWFPWSIVLLTSGAGGADAPIPGAGSMIVLVGVFLACAVGTYLTLDRADNTQ